MKTYAVGGSVRDGMMKRRISDYDWVVVGSTEEEMLQNGFTKVGADFPVFLHPTNGQEYALARREKKTGSGYLGFEFNTGIEMVLEDGTKIKTLNPELMQKFIELGYDPEKYYSVDELILVFQRINL